MSNEGFGLRPGSVPNEIMAARDEIAAAIEAEFQIQPSTEFTDNFQGAGNVQGVSIGLGEAGPDGSQSPVVEVHLAESTPHDDARSALVDAMGVRSAGDVPIRFITTGIIEALDDNKRLVRPAPGGFSIGNCKSGGAGTLGCLVKRTAPDDDRTLLLSNNHVLARLNEAQPGDRISQPAVRDNGSCPEDDIAQLTEFWPLKFDCTPNYVDCAVAACDDGAVKPQIGYTEGGTVNYFDISDQPVAASLKMQVGKSGRTTGRTRGSVTGLQWSGVIRYRNNTLRALFHDQLTIQGAGGNHFAAPGDSGSCIWTWEAPKNPVGLLFAGSQQSGHVYANPISAVLKALKIELYTGK
jgi:hypothetical protein